MWEKQKTTGRETKETRVIEWSMALIYWEGEDGEEC